MTNKINIMLILFLGITPSWSKSLSNISNTMKVNYQNNTEQFVSLYRPISTENNDGVILIRPEEVKSFLVFQKEHLGNQTFEQNFIAYEQIPGWKSVPSKKSNIRRRERQYAWYIEDRPLTIEETPNVGKGMYEHSNPRRSHSLETYAKLLHYLTHNFHSSLSMVGLHYWVIAGYR